MYEAWSLFTLLQNCYLSFSKLKIKFCPKFQKTRDNLDEDEDKTFADLLCDSAY